MANMFTSFARRNFGGRRSFGSKVGRAFRGKNPFARKITIGSAVMRPAERLITMTAMQAADGAVLAGAGLIGMGALKVLKQAASATVDIVTDVVQRQPFAKKVIVEKDVVRTRRVKVVDDEQAH